MKRSLDRVLGEEEEEEETSYTCHCEMRNPAPVRRFHLQPSPQGWKSGRAAVACSSFGEISKRSPTVFKAIPFSPDRIWGCIMFFKSLLDDQASSLNSRAMLYIVSRC